jgi:hypothetical protein
MRKVDWPELLTIYIEECMNKPFVWGEHDCAKFAGNWIEICTGEAVGVYGGKYTTERGAYALLKRKHSGELTIAVDKVLKRQAVAKAGRGDIVMRESGLGICLGQQSAFPSYEGLTFYDTLTCEHAWSVN